MTKICLIGSTKFKDEFDHYNKLFSKSGHVVYSVAAFGHSGDTLTEEDKIVLDCVHLRKIMESDEVFCINKDGYIGESTRRELHFALVLYKRIKFMVNDKESERFVIADCSNWTRPLAAAGEG